MVDRLARRTLAMQVTCTRRAAGVSSPFAEAKEKSQSILRRLNYVYN
jgi:hypothetical protein